MRKKLPKVLLVLLSTGLTLLTLEGAARILVRLGVVDYWRPMKTVWIEGTDDWRLNHITADNLREPDPELFWKPVARAPYNAQRFKGPLMVVPKPRGVFRILCYGDSNTEGPKEGSWPEILEEVLNRHRSPPGRRYEVVNAGVAGYSSYQGLLRFRQEVATYQPDLVIVSFGWNDVAQAVGRADHEFYPSWLQVQLMRALFKSRLYLVLLKNIPLRNAAAIDHSLPEVARVPLTQYIVNMERFVELAKQHGSAIVFLTRPHRKPAVTLSQMPSWRGKVPSYNETLRGWAKKNGFVLFDVETLFDNLGAAYFNDECHLTKEGHRTLAEALAPVLLREPVPISASSA
ncbi:MAG TPA: SGNH/GDSL hydrolase family protein [Candidatus Binatia bacterium]|nr:SGNH/GDSL hydrolase family protein [Candidatus Binatia bacterium]